MIRNSSKLKIALISSELAPFAKTGGLADMVASLGGALHALGMEPVFFLPKYKLTTATEAPSIEEKIKVRLGSDCIEARIWKGRHAEAIEVVLIDMPRFFDRPGVYGEMGSDYADNCARYASFNRAVLEYMKCRQTYFDILHVHDWHTALIPLYLKTVYRNDPFFKRTRSVLTIHNLGYQGIFSKDKLDQTGLDWNFFTPRYFEFYNKINLLKGGLISADALNTVSPTYAKEILTPEFGAGLEGVLAHRQDQLIGILNGIDTGIWDPASDAYLPERFSGEDMQGKKGCKLALQQEVGLPLKLKTPLISIVSRLVEQKGIDLIIRSIPALIHLNIQIIFHGKGENDLETSLSALARTYPEKIAAKVGFYDEGLAHRIKAGSDFFLMPSRYEPCGLTQMYSQRYGTLPLVHDVGGLSDSVIDARQAPEAGTGLLFKGATTENISRIVFEALSFYGSSNLMPHLRENAMQQDFSWKSSARDYCHLYEETLSKPATDIPQGFN